MLSFKSFIQCYPIRFKSTVPFPFGKRLSEASSDPSIYTITKDDFLKWILNADEGLVQLQIHSDGSVIFQFVRVEID